MKQITKPKEIKHKIVNNKSLDFKNIKSFYKFIMKTKPNNKRITTISKEDYIVIHEQLKKNKQLSIKKRTKQYIKGLFYDHCVTGCTLYDTESKGEFKAIASIKNSIKIPTVYNNSKVSDIKKTFRKLSIDDKKIFNDFVVFFFNNNIVKKNKQTQKLIQLFFSCYQNGKQNKKMIQQKLNSFVNGKLNATEDFLFSDYYGKKLKTIVPKNKYILLGHRL